MKTIYLMRHAKASSDSPTFEDRDRALNARGKEDAPRMAAEMKSRGYVPDLILCSSARRTQETCRPMLDTLGSDIPTVYDPGLYLASEEEILETIQRANPAADTLLVIGHNPGLEELAFHLAAGGGPPKFPTSALAVFHFDVETWPQVARRKGRFAAYLTPKMLLD